LGINLAIAQQAIADDSEDDQDELASPGIKGSRQQKNIL